MIWHIWKQLPYDGINAPISIQTGILYRLLGALGLSARTHTRTRTEDGTWYLEVSQTALDALNATHSPSARVRSPWRKS